jgi:hypothetical protein
MAGASRLGYAVQAAEQGVFFRANRRADPGLMVSAERWDVLTVQSRRDNSASSLTAKHRTWWANARRASQIGSAGKHGVMPSSYCRHAAVVRAPEGEEQTQAASGSRSTYIVGLKAGSKGCRTRHIHEIGRVLRLLSH